MQFIFTQTGVQDTQPNRRACCSLYSLLGSEKASIPVLFQPPYFRLQKMRLHSVEVKTLPTGKPYPLSCSDNFGIFFSIATSGMQTICTHPLFLGWFWSERLNEWSRVDGRWNTCSERWLCVFLRVLCVTGCFFPLLRGYSLCLYAAFSHL